MKFPKTDVVVVCALEEEMDAVKEAVRANWSDVPTIPADRYRYARARVSPTAGDEIEIVAAFAPTMGLTAAAVLTTKMILRFRPRLVAMIGVAGGVKKDGRDYGDILLPDTTFDYETGKMTKSGEDLVVEKSPNPLNVDSTLIQRIRSFATPTVLSSISNSYRGTPSDTKLKLIVGPVGSGALVLGAEEPVTEIKNGYSRKLAGFEMELYAVHRACKEACHPAPLFVGMKSIMDFGVGKGDQHKHYAAYTAAECFVQFLKHDWENLPLPEVPPPANAAGFHLRDVLQLAVECLQTLLSIRINGRYFEFVKKDEQDVLRRMDDLHVEKTLMPGEQALKFAYIKTDKLAICECYRTNAIVLQRLNGTEDYEPRIESQIDSTQRWALCAPVEADGAVLGVVCFFSREDLKDLESSEGLKESVHTVATACARAIASGLKGR